MRYLRELFKYVQRGGLVATMLIGGVLGGLLAPLPSDALPPTLTLQIDGLALQQTTNGSTFTTVALNTILGAKLSACSSADQGLGYTDCYSIVTSTTVAYRANNGRLYRIQNAPSATARLRVGDNLGPDFFSVVGLQIVPVNTANQAAAPSTAHRNTLTDWGSADANTNETHTLTMRFRNTFNSGRNVNNATQYNPMPNGTVIANTKLAAAIRLGGRFTSGIVDTFPTHTVAVPPILYCGTAQTPARCNTVGNNVTYTATGKFKDGVSQNVLNVAPATPNQSPLTFTVANTATNRDLTSASWNGLTNATLGQVDPNYPKFECRTAPGSTTCQEEMDHLITVTLKGPDTFVITDGGDGAQVLCNTADQTRLTRLFTLLTKLVNFLDLVERNRPNEELRKLIDQAKAFLLTFNMPTDPECPATKIIRAQFLFSALSDEADNVAAGALPAEPEPPAPETGTIRIIKNTVWCCEPPSGGPPFPNGTFHFHIVETPEGGGPQVEVATPQIDITDGTGTGMVSVSLPVGLYDVAEINLDQNWTFHGQSCDNGEFGTVQLNQGETVTCTVTNENNFVPPPPLGVARITIHKDAFITGDPCGPQCPILTARFRFFITEGDSFNELRAINLVTDALGHGIGEVSLDVVGGGGFKYSVSEENPSSTGWTQQIGNCNGVPWNPGVPCTFTIQAGETRHVFFVNSILIIF